MKTLFLNPPHPLNIKLDIQRYTLRTRAGSLFPPIWLSWAAASVPNSRVVDSMASTLSADDVVLIAKDYDLVVMQVDTATVNPCIQVADFIKQSTGVQVCFVGPHVSVKSCAEDVLHRANSVDYVARREYDYTIKELVEGQHPRKILGLSYKENDLVYHNPDRPFIKNLDELPFVNPIYKRDLPFKVYRIHELRHPFTTIFSSRGCRYGCKYYCRWPAVFDGSEFRARSPVNVFEEVRWVKENMPEIKEILFDEGTFTTMPKRAEEICDLIKPLDVTWSCNARADVPFETLKKMKESGCRLLIVGFESSHQEILNTIRKGEKLEWMKQFVNDCKKVGLLIHGTFMIGLPGETKHTIEDNFKLAVKLDLDSIQFSVATPYPGTEFWDYLKEKGWLTSTNYVNKDGLQQAVYCYPNLSQEEIEHAAETLHKRFIFRSKFIFKAFQLSLSNKDEAKRIARGFYEYIAYLRKARRNTHKK
jgi:radical SAM superfamily enzyme YgiQ (UPF0313 family)